MPSKSEPPFPPDYRAARKAFIAACVEARADTISRAHMGKSGPDGKPMFIDSVALGPRDAKKAVLMIANDARTSAAIATLVREGVTVPDGMRLVVVHALDPFAFMKVPGDLAWSHAMLKAIATEDLSRVAELTVFTFGAAEDELPAIFPTDRKVKLLRRHANNAINAAQMRRLVQAEFARA